MIFFKNKKSLFWIFPTLFLGLISFSSCRKEDTPPLLKIPVTNLKFTVNPTIQPPDTYYIPINQVKFNALALLDAKGIDTASIKSIRPSRAFFSVVFNESKLDFLDAISVRLCPIGQNEPNCGQEVFYRDPVPRNTDYELDLVPSDVKDVRDAVLLDKINVQIKIERLWDYPNGTFDVNLDMEFEVR